MHEKASDIHIETEAPPKRVKIRFRIDGELVRYLEVEARFRYALVARIKIMAGMDISEHRKPQDGKIDFARFGGSKTELRVVTVPTANGLEDVVLRLLAGSKPLPIDGVRSERARFGRAAPHGAQTLWLDSGVRPHRQRQNHHPAFAHQRHQHRGTQNLDRRRPD